MEQDWEQEEFDITGLRLIKPFYREDMRGYFLKDYEKDILRKFGIQGSVSEIFETGSRKAVIRGLHFQTKEPQAKLVRVVQGEIYDVAVDLRRNSSTFGKFQAVYLNDRDNKIFYIPVGFAHGFQVVSKYATVSYQCIGRYLKEFDTGIHYRDIQIGIPWPLKECVVSQKDCSLMSFEEFIKNYAALEGSEYEDSERVEAGNIGNDQRILRSQI